MNESNVKRAALALTVFWLFFCLFPLWWVFVTAFKPPQAVSGGATYLPFVDFQPTMQAFHDAASGIRGDFVGPIMSSLIVSTLSTALAVLLGSMAAYALVRFEFRVRLLAGVIFAVISIGGFAVLTEMFDVKIPYAVLIVLVVALVVSVLANRADLPGPVLKNDDVTFWFVSQRMFPPIVSAFALFLLYAEMNKVGFRLLDSLPGLVLAYTAFGLPFSVWLMRDFFESVPIEVEEAATVDGIGRARIFFQIVLPMSKPGLIATSMIILAFIWNEFLFALLLTSSKCRRYPY